MQPFHLKRKSILQLQVLICNGIFAIFSPQLFIALHSNYTCRFELELCVSFWKE